MSENSPPQVPAPTLLPTNKDHWLQWAKWLYEDQRLSYQQAGSQSVTLLGFNGVILSVLLSRGFPDGTATARILLTIGSVLLSISSLVSIAAALPRPIESINLRIIQQEWTEFNCSRNDNNLPFQATEHLLQGSLKALGVSPIIALAKKAEQRSQLLRFASGASALGVTILGALLIIEKWN